VIKLALYWGRKKKEKSEFCALLPLRKGRGKEDRIAARHFGGRRKKKKKKGKEEKGPRIESACHITSTVAPF